MAVALDRHDQPAELVQGFVLEAGMSLVHVPPVVLDTGTRSGCEVDLLDALLTDVGEVEVAGLAVERETPDETARPTVWITATAASRPIGTVAIDVELQEVAEP